MTTALAWGFGIVMAVLLLGSLVKRRRDHLVKLLRTHVENKIGPTVDGEQPKQK